MVAAVSYNYFTSSSVENVSMDDDGLTVDVGDYEARFSVSRDFQGSYMLFGGGYFEDEGVINPIVLSGLGIVDAKLIYSKYPDFHLCASPGAALAQPKVKHLNLIPADGPVLDELKATLEVYEDNLGRDGDRVCVSLMGKTLRMRSAIVHENNRDIKDQLPSQTYYWIHSSERIGCKSLLD